MKLKGTKIVGNMSLDTGYGVKVVIDTGSPITILRCEHLSILTGCDSKEIRKVCDESKNFRLLKGYNSDPFIVIPCCLRGVTLGDMHGIDKFYFGLSTAGNGNPIIGLDILSSSKFYYDFPTFNLMSLNYRRYIDYFVEFFNNMKIEEVNEILPVDSRSLVQKLLDRAQGD